MTGRNRSLVPYWWSRAVLLAGLIAVSAPFSLDARAADPPKVVKSPVSPAESLTHFQLPTGLAIELVAAEPEVISPVAIAFDEDDWMYVVEMRDYPNGPGPGKPPLSQIRLLEDRDHDGRYETAHLFADKLLFPTGVQPWQGGVIVTLAGEIIYLKDTNGDHKADLRETWFRGFVEQNPQLRANHPTFGPDNRIYVANGLRGGTIVADPKKWGAEQPAVSIAGKDFRFDPRTGQGQTVAGVSQFAMTFDDDGNRFLCDNRHPCRHVVLEDRYTARNPYLTVATVMNEAIPPDDKSKVYPLSRAWVTSTLHTGQFTAACGTLIFRGHALPEESYANVFVCEPTGNLVHREVLEGGASAAHFANLATFYGRTIEKRTEFLATRDEWFRPVDLANGPDGALYVVDMYRAVIEHPEWVPAELKNRSDLLLGNDKGRIYRVLTKEAQGARPAAVRLSQATPAELVTALTDPSPWRRDTARRLLYERNDRSVVAQLRTLAKSGPFSEARLAALWALDGLEGIDEPTLEAAVIDGDPGVRRQAFVLAEPRLKSLAADSPIIQQLLKVDSPPKPVLFQQVLSMGALIDLDEERAAPVRVALAQAGLDGSRDEWFRTAVLTSAGDKPHLLFREMMTQQRFLAYPRFPTYALMLHDLGEVIGARRVASEMMPVLAAIVTLREIDDEERKSAVQRIMLGAWNGLAEGVARRGGSISEIIAKIEELEEGVLEGLKPLFDDALALARSEKASTEMRSEAVAALAHVGFPLSGETLLDLATGDREQKIRLQAIGVLATYRDPQIADRLLVDFDAQTPTIRRAVLQALIADEERTKRLLDEIAAGRIKAAELDPITVQKLTKHKVDAIREQAARVLSTTVPGDRKKVLDQYQAALKLVGDAKRGKLIFEKNCTACHRIENKGVDVAPDIADSRTRTPEKLLVDILHPNQTIDANYVGYVVTMKNGKSHTGVISADTPVSIALRQPEGRTAQLLRADVETIHSTGISLMPEGLEKNITVPQMADLIAYIKNWRYLDGLTPLEAPSPGSRGTERAR